MIIILYPKHLYTSIETLIWVSPAPLGGLNTPPLGDGVPHENDLRKNFHQKFPNMKYALYSRVSTTDQTNENQIIRLKEFAQLKGWDYDLYEEQESTRKSRPVKARMLQRLRSGEYQGLVVVKLDRYARSSTELLLEISELTKKGIEFHSITEQLDFSTATGKLHFTILSAFAEFERDIIRQRTLEGLHRARMQGKKVGRPVGSKDRGKRKNDGYLLREAKRKVERLSNLPPNNA